ncbi:MAG: hypothetical protein MUC62_08355 [Candidatus Thermoplasmatota archaeon]|nr:hypothetical protein [Candidatus Thermoplasmatota archaeon]
MDNGIFSISLQESNGLRIWESDDLPQPNEVSSGTARYYGQRTVKELLRMVNQKAFIDHMDRFLDPMFSIFESALEQGVEENASVQWDDNDHFIKTSWTNYSWKLPPELKRRMVQIDISKTEGQSEGTIKVPFKKLADDGSVILLSPKLLSKMNLRKGNPVTVKVRFCDR